MGRFAALVVLGLIIAVMALASTLTSEYAKGASMRDMLMEKAQAKNIASTISGAYVGQLKNNPGLSGRFEVRHFMSGSAVVSITRAANEEYEISTVAHYRNALEEVRIRVTDIRSGNPGAKDGM